MTELFEPDGPHDVRVAVGAPPGRLRDLNAAGLLTAADLQVARRVGELAARAAGRDASVLAALGDDDTVLVLALCLRALRAGSVCVDLAAPPEVDGATWPASEAWAEAVDRSDLVAQGVLHRTGTLVHLDRYHREEEQVAADLRAREELAAPRVDEARLAADLDRVFPEDRYAEQRAAARHAVTRRTTVLTGGPGTGKTTAVAGILQLLEGQAQALGVAAPRVALAAPTGKAAARLGEAIAEAGLEGFGATTLHRLLGRRPGSDTRFRHDRAHRLPYDVVVVDESSMLSLSMTARLLEAVRPETRLILVGDPDQLASVEAGAVLADLVAGFADPDGPVVRLRTSHRFGGRIGDLAAALRQAAGLDDVQAADAVLAVAAAAASEPAAAPGPAEGDVRLVALPDDDGVDARLLDELRAQVLPHARRLRAVAESGDVEQALEVLAEHRLLCAHRAGPRGVASLNQRIEGWLADEDAGVVPGGSYAGRPLLVFRNDPQLGLYNGDTGVVVRSSDDGSLRAVFATGGARRDLAVSRLGDVETMHAMTIHKAQGSQARSVTVVLPEVDSPLLTRELLYTAVTRASALVTMIGSEASLRGAVLRHVQRASGLRERLRPRRSDG